MTTINGKGNTIINTAKQSKPTTDPLALEIQRLRAENEALKAAKTKEASGQVSYKVADKGGVSIYGMGRFPVTAYAFTKASVLAGQPVFEGSQLHKLVLACGGDAAKAPVVAFVKANAALIMQRMKASLAAKAAGAETAAEADAL